MEHDNQPYQFARYPFGPEHWPYALIILGEPGVDGYDGTNQLLVLDLAQVYKHIDTFTMYANAIANLKGDIQTRLERVLPAGEKGYIWLEASTQIKSNAIIAHGREQVRHFVRNHKKLIVSSPQWIQLCEFLDMEHNYTITKAFADILFAINGRLIMESAFVTFTAPDGDLVEWEDDPQGRHPSKEWADKYIDYTEMGEDDEYYNLVIDHTGDIRIQSSLSLRQANLAPLATIMTERYYDVLSWTQRII